MGATQTAAFKIPDHSEVMNLITGEVGRTVLEPTDRVYAINRGREPQEATYDGKHVVLPPGYFITEYGAALHFQKRLIVKGTRNLEQGGFVSWISILGSEDGRIKVDDESICQPFTDEELQRFGEKVEAIDRSVMGELDRNVRTIKTSAARATVAGQGQSSRPVISAADQATEAARAAAESVFETPESSATREAEAEAATDVEAPVPARRRAR